MPEIFSCKRSWLETGVEQRDIFWVLFLWDWLQPAHCPSPEFTPVFENIVLSLWQHSARPGSCMGRKLNPSTRLAEGGSSVQTPISTSPWDLDILTKASRETSGHRLTLSRLVGELFTIPRGHLSPKGSVEAQRSWHKSNKGWCRGAASSPPFINERWAQRGPVALLRSHR